MAELPPSGVDVAVEVARIASMPGSLVDRAEALLEPLHRVIPFEAAWICLIDMERRGFVNVVSHGYNEASRAYFAGPVVFEEAGLLGFGRPRPPMRMQDMPLPWSELRGWAEYMWPAGFREGLGAGLFTPDGRHVGLLTLNTDSAAHPTVGARDLVGALTPMIAAAVDPMRSISMVAGMVGDATAGTVLTRAGDPLPLPGLSSHLLLRAGSIVLPVAASQLAGRTVASFLCPYREGESADHQVRVTVLACPRDVPDYLSAIVLVSPPGELHRLTSRELEVLGLLVEGWPNLRIAAILFLAERTVAAHLEHILAKLAVPTRAAAAALALRQGLYFPRQLTLGLDRA
jgi:DNA-binding CsgD family transcriptional regulator